MNLTLRRTVGVIALVALALGVSMLAPSPGAAARSGPAAEGGAPPGQFTFYDLPDGITSQSLTFTPDGSLWFIDGDGFSGNALVEFDTETGTVVDTHADFEGGYRDLVAGPGGLLWFASMASGGSGSFNPTTETFARSPQSPSPWSRSTRATDVVVAGGRAWLSRDDDTLMLGMPFDDSEGCQCIAVDNWMPQATVEGPNDRIWMMVEPYPGGGAARLAHVPAEGGFPSGGSVTVLGDNPSWPSDAGSTLTPGPGGTSIWYTLSGGATFRIATTATSMTSAANVPPPVQAEAMVLGDDGNVWSVAFDPGNDRLVRSFPNGVSSVFRHARLDHPTDIVVEPGTGHLWIANGDELARFVPPPVALCDGRKVTVDLAYPASRQWYSDVIRGTAGADRIDAGPGRDVVCAGGGNDTIIDRDTSEEVDRYFGQGGNDRVTATRGNDHVDGGPGADVLFGGDGRDRLVGGPQRDTCNGGPGTDSHAGCEVRSAIP